MYNLYDLPFIFSLKRKLPAQTPMWNFPLMKTCRKARYKKKTRKSLAAVDMYLSAVKAFLFPQVVYASKDPMWEEGFTFFVHDVKRQQLNVQVCRLLLNTSYIYIRHLHITFTCSSMFAIINLDTLHFTIFIEIWI